MSRATIAARVESALRSEHAKLCGYLLDFVERPEAQGPISNPVLLRGVAKRLDQIEAHLANPGPLVDRVIAALEAA